MDLNGTTLVDLRGHCAFCRRRLKERGPQYILYIEESHGSSKRIVAGEDQPDTGGEQEDIKVVPKAVIRVPFVSFSHIWDYLLKTGTETVGSDNSLFVKYQFATEEEDDDDIHEVPPMCQCCGERIQELDKLHRELMQKVEDIKRIVAESCGGGKHSWRNEELEKALGDSSLEASMKVSSFQFLNSLMVSSRKSVPKSSKASIYDKVKEEVDSPVSNDQDCGEGGDQYCGEFPDVDTPPNMQSFYNSDDEDEKIFDDEEPSNSSNSFENSSQKNCSTAVQTLNKLNRRKAKCQTDDGDFTECTNLDKGVVLPTQEYPFPGKVEDEDEESQNSTDSFEAKCSISSDVDPVLNSDSEDDGSVEYQNEVSKESEDSEEGDSDSPSEDNRSSKLAPRKKSSKTPYTENVKRISQQCDLCKERIPFPKIRQHLESHNVQEYICKCPNPECNFTFSNRRSLDALHLWDRKNRFIKCQNVFTQLNNNAGSNWSHVCETCGEHKKTVWSLRKHLSRTHETETSKSYNCPISDCSKRFSVKQSLEFHLDRHELGSQHKQRCPLCKGSRRRKNKDEIMDHLKNVHNVEEIFECKQSQCTFLFPNRNHLLEHLRQHRHVGILCDICDDGVKYSSYDGFREHYVSAHRIGATFSCRQRDCDKVFYMKGKLEEHVSAEHPEQKWKYERRVPVPGSDCIKNKQPMIPCDACSETFKSEDRLYAHKIKEHGAPEILRCKHCDLTFLLKRGLERHQKMHSGSTGFKCEYENCNKSFESRKGFYEHRSSHPQAICDICKKEFKSRKILKQHVNSVHLGLKKFVCNVCGAGLSSSYGLSLHKRIHTGERPFLCQICSKNFKCKSTLSKHLLIHNKSKSPEKTSEELLASFRIGSRKRARNKTVICETCGNGFVSIYNLQKHRETFHTDKPNRGIICDICGDAFSSDLALKLHNRIHTGERPYSCHICNQTFRCHSNLTAHLRRHKLKGEKFRPRGPVQNFKRKRRQPSNNDQS